MTDAGELEEIMESWGENTRIMPQHNEETSVEEKLKCFIQNRFEDAILSIEDEETISNIRQLAELANECELEYILLETLQEI